LNRYFPEGRPKPITEKWKDVPKKLARDGLIKDSTRLRGQIWQTFREKSV